MVSLSHGRGMKEGRSKKKGNPTTALTLKKGKKRLRPSGETMGVSYARIRNEQVFAKRKMTPGKNHLKRRRKRI